MNFQDLPLDVHQAFASHLGVEDVLFSYLTASKTLNLIALECLKMVRKNTVDVMITGLHRSGVSKVFCELLKNDVHNRSTWRTLNATTDIYKVEVGSGCYANVFHLNTNPRSRLGSYTLYGITQCVVVVVAVDADVKAVRELLCSVYGMSGHLNVIFVINKMDIVQFSDKSYTTLCQSITDECKKLSEALAKNISFIPSCRGSNLLSCAPSSEMPWYTDRSLCNKLAEISRGVRVPVYKYFKPANIIIIMSRNLRPKIELALQSKLQISAQIGAKTYYRLVMGYITEGLVSVGDTIWLNPLNFQKCGQMHGHEVPKFPCKVESIQYYNQNQRTIAAGNFVGLIVKLQFNKDTIVTYKKQKILFSSWFDKAWTRMNLRNPLKLKKVYHVLTGSSDATSYKRLEIQVAMCGSNAPSDSWTGKLTENYSPGFYSLGLRTFCTIKRIISVHDLNGEEVKFEENQQRAVVKGQKATLEVMLATPGPLTLFDRTKNSTSYSNGEGRCCLVVNSNAVAIGIVTKLLELKTDDSADQ